MTKACVLFRLSGSLSWHLLSLLWCVANPIINLCVKAAKFVGQKRDNKRVMFCEMVDSIFDTSLAFLTREHKLTGSMSYHLCRYDYLPF